MDDFVQRAHEDIEQLWIYPETSHACNAILSLRCGGGGDEASWWAKKLLVMYSQWTAHSGRSIELVHCTEGPAGPRQVTLMVRGRGSYGWLRAEGGTHRFTRITPGTDKRHTSFVHVEVIPVTNTSANLAPRSEFRVDYFRASGKGGQHVNKTETAVRVVHEPSGIQAQSQSRSRKENLKQAFAIAHARLIEAERARSQAHEQAARAGRDVASFGGRRRTYSLSPAPLVHDHLSGWKSTQIDKTLGGEIEELLFQGILHSS